MSQAGRNTGDGRPYVVEVPRDRSRLGPALRRAYDRDQLPDDMLACLDRLDRLTGGN